MGLALAVALDPAKPALSRDPGHRLSLYSTGAQAHKLFTKSTAGTGDPSVVHIWIFPGDGLGLMHTVDNDNDNDGDKITKDDSSAIGSFYYILVSNFVVDDITPLKPITSRSWTTSWDIVSF